MSKKENIIILIIIAVLIFFIATVLTFIIYTKDDSNLIYRYTKSYFNLGFLKSDEFRIYENGLVLTVEHYGDIKFKVSKISEEEIEELKELIESLEDNKKEIEESKKDLEDISKIVYNKESSKKIILYNENQVSRHINTSENCEKILELVEEIYNKHKGK